MIGREGAAVAIAGERSEARVHLDASAPVETNMEGVGGSVTLKSRGPTVKIDILGLERKMTRVTRLAERVRDRVGVRMGRISGRSNLAWVVLSAIAFAALLYLGYLFLDAGTRGQFSWSLRIVSLITFVVMLAAVHALH